MSICGYLTVETNIFNTAFMKTSNKSNQGEKNNKILDRSIMHDLRTIEKRSNIAILMSEFFGRNVATKMSFSSKALVAAETQAVLRHFPVFYPSVNQLDS